MTEAITVATPGKPMILCFRNTRSMRRLWRDTGSRSRAKTVRFPASNWRGMCSVPHMPQRRTLSRWQGARYLEIGTANERGVEMLEGRPHKAGRSSPQERVGGAIKGQKFGQDLVGGIEVVGHQSRAERLHTGMPLISR